MGIIDKMSRKPEKDRHGRSRGLDKWLDSMCSAILPNTRDCYALRPTVVYEAKGTGSKGNTGTG